MGIKFNPLTGLFDIAGSGGSVTIGGPVVGSAGNSILTTDGNGDLTEKVLADGEVLIGVTGGEPIAAPLTGTINQVIVSGGPGSITLSLPQNVDTTSNPTFSTINLTDPVNQLNLGTGVAGLVISSGTGAASRTYTFPDVGATASVVMTEGNQTINGDKSFTGSILATNVDALTVGGTLNFGATAAGPMTFGNSNSVINFNGTVFNNNVTNLNVADKLITVNDGGGATSGFDSGLEIEEGGVITGYSKTSMDRNSFLIKAPGTLGIATITPGPAGITLDQDSHNPITLGAVGSTPNAFASTINGTQVLNLEPADATNPGVVTASAQSFGGAKTLQSSLTVIGATTLAASLTGPVRATSGLISTSNIDAATEISGILPIVNGGTGVLTNPLNGQILIGSTGTGYVVNTLTSGAGVVINNLPGSITISSSITQYTDEMAQDSVGSILTDTSTVDFTYNDALNTITAAVIPAGIDMNDLAGVLDVSNGGTGTSAVPVNGAVLIGNAAGSAYVSAVLTSGLGILIANAAGSVTVSNTDRGSTAVTAHEALVSNAHVATAITYNNTISGLAATNVQTAISEVQANIVASQDDRFTSTVASLAQTNTISLAGSLGGVIYLSVVNSVSSLRSLYEIHITQDFSTTYTHTVDITGPNQSLTFSMSAGEVFQIFNSGAQQVTCTGRYVAVV